MTIGFETLSNIRKEVTAGIHPYDYSARPQILSKSQNENYYNLIEEFFKLSGVPALLNTRNNLHGSPIVNDVKDAVYTFENSSLDYVLFNYKYLISKGS